MIFYRVLMHWRIKRFHSVAEMLDFSCWSHLTPSNETSSQSKPTGGSTPDPREIPWLRKRNEPQRLYAVGTPFSSRSGRLFHHTHQNRVQKQYTIGRPRFESFSRNTLLLLHHVPKPQGVTRHDLALSRATVALHIKAHLSSSQPTFFSRDPFIIKHGRLDSLVPRGWKQRDGGAKSWVSYKVI